MSSNTTERSKPTEQGPVILYDGVCAVCNGFTRFVLPRDSAGLFRFAALQSDYAKQRLVRHGRDPELLHTVYVLLHPESDDESLIEKSEAVLYALRRIRGWSWLAGVLKFLPRVFRDWCYDLVARHRYKLFGRYDECVLPQPEWHERFID